MTVYVRLRRSPRTLRIRRFIAKRIAAVGLRLSSTAKRLWPEAFDSGWPSRPTTRPLSRANHQFRPDARIHEAAAAIAREARLDTPFLIAPPARSSAAVLADVEALIGPPKGAA